MENKEMNVFGSLSNMFDGLFAKDMKTNIEETDKEYILSIEVPGMKRSDIEISFFEDSLVVKTKAQKEENKKYITKERVSFDLSRSYYLEDADDEAIRASLEDGILTIVVAKKQNISNPKKVIEID